MDIQGTSLAQPLGVVVSPPAVSRRAAALVTRRTGALRGAARRGFTLLELMVVVIIVGVIAALAVPSMRIATFDRHAYQDAGAIMQLFREARLRAVARGAAVVVSMTGNGVGDRGTFMMYEGVQPDPGGGNLMPSPSCKNPSQPWNLGGPGSLFVEGINLNGRPEAEADIETQLYSYATDTSQQASWMVVCYTPLGHSYVVTSNTGSGTVTAPIFTGTPTTLVLEARVLHGVTSGPAGAVSRSVLVAPNGMPRLFSKVL